jgi:hypothetical protein
MSNKQLIITEADLKDLDLPRKLMLNGHDTKTDIQLNLNNGEVVVKPARQMIVLIIGLRAHIVLGAPIKAVHFNYVLTGRMTSERKFEIWTEYYKELVDSCAVDHHAIYQIYAEAVNYLSNFIVRFLGAYQQSMSILSLSKIQCDKALKDIVNVPYRKDVSTDVIEKDIELRTKELTRVLSTKDTIKDNVLYTFMMSGGLKKNQIPQQMIAFGTRSDIDDVMMKNWVPSSAMRGIQNVTEYGIEGLSVKKSEHYKKDVICDSQYSARGTRLNCSILPHRYPGDCGSRLLLPYVIPDRSAFNYLDKVCFINGEKVNITMETLPHLVGKTIELISPLGCRYTDGVCEHCAGRATTRPWAFIPDVHLGMYSATKVGDAVSQMVLSAKHLIRTKSILYEFVENASDYFTMTGTDISVNSAICDRVKGWKMKVPIRFIGHIAGHGNEMKIEESLTEISYIVWVFDDGTELTVNMSNDRVCPYFSTKFLEYLRCIHNDISITEDDEYVIPMDKYNIRWPVMKYNIINDDMVSYTENCDKFVKDKVASYKSASMALRDFAAVIYSKSSINIFYLEVLLRTMMRKPGEEPGLPIVEDYNNVRFGGICKNISTHTLSQKLVFERLGMTSKSDGLFAHPHVSLIDRLPGLYDPLLFGSV